MHEFADPGLGGTVEGLLLVHAHPDDESCATGGTIAHHVDAGVDVTLVTCTRGEQGRIALPQLAHLAADQQDRLGQYRAGELRAALHHLGVGDHHYLGGEGRFRDSGRMGLKSNEHPEAFWQANVDEAAAWLAELIDRRRPQAVVTYDPNGGYGHPDHIQTHRVTMRALELASWRSPLVYWCAVPENVLATQLSALAEREKKLGRMWIDPDPSNYPDGVHPDQAITTELDITQVWQRKRSAMSAHRTQLKVVDDCWVLASGRGNLIQDKEWFIRVEKGPDGFQPVQVSERETGILG